MGWTHRPKPWSKLKARIEALWVPGLPLAIHANAYTHRTDHDSYQLPRHWFLLDGEVIFDFPGPFMVPNPARGAYIHTFEDLYVYRDEASKPIPAIPGWRHQPSHIISLLLRDYLDRPRDRLMEPFKDDYWEFTDILRAADARIGKARLRDWSKTLDDGHPARKVLAARFRDGL